MADLRERLANVAQKDGVGYSFRMFLIDAVARERETGGGDVIRLTLGQSDLPLHTTVTSAIISALTDPVKSTLVIPEGLPALRHALAEYYARQYRARIPTSRILIDAGTSSLYPLLFNMLVGAGNQVLLPLPYYPLYLVSALMAGVAVRYYSIDWETMRIDLTSFRKGITANTRLVVVNSPGNPFGNVVSQGELSEMIGALPNDAFIVFDEIYENVIFGRQKALCPLLLGEGSPYSERVVITNSFSKGFRMYTKRIGWCVLPECLVDTMRILLQHTRLTVDPSVQYGATEALQRMAEVDHLRAVHLERWRYTRQRMKGLAGVRLLESGGGFYCCLDCRVVIARCGLANCLELATDILERTSVAVVPGADFGVPGVLRLSFTAARYEEGVERLRSYFGRMEGLH